MKRTSGSVIIILSLVIVFLACRLHKVNREFDLLKFTSKPVLTYKPVVVEKGSTLKIGDEYRANIYLVGVNPSLPPLIRVNRPILQTGFDPDACLDTLTFDLDYLTHEVSFVPDAAGSYTWGGVIVHPEDEKEYYFMGSFLVEE